MYKKGKTIKKVNLEDLPHRGKIIDWKNSVGYSIEFQYDDVIGTLTIIKWYSNKTVDVKYLDEVWNLPIRTIAQVKLAGKLHKRNYDWKYEIGQQITGSNGFSGKILKRYYKKTAMSNNSRCYDIQCDTCNQVVSKIENTVEKTGCEVCGNGKLRVGYNDLWTTHKEIAKQLLNPEDGYKTTYGARIFLDWRCPYCGRTRHHLTPSQVISAIGEVVPCECHSDAYSFPNKFMFNILTQLGETFIFEKGFSEWEELGLRRYDFYLPVRNIIIEMHGGQHYDGRFPEISVNDKEKKDIALSHGIKNYIVIDCSKSNSTFIMNELKKSYLNSIFNFEVVNIELANYMALKSTIDKAVALLQENNFSVSKAAKIMQIDRTTVSNYLNTVIRNGLLDEYEVRTKQTRNKADNHYQIDAKPVMCLDNGYVFGNYTKVKEFLEPKYTKNFSSGSLVQGLNRANGTSYGFHWKRITKAEFNRYKQQNPNKAFGDYFINV